MAAPAYANDMTIREIINDRLEELGVSRYRLVNCDDLEGVSPSTAFRFLNGEHDALSESVEAMLRACGLRIVPSKRVPPWVRKLKAG